MRASHGAGPATDAGEAQLGRARQTAARHPAQRREPARAQRHDARAEPDPRRLDRAAALFLLRGLRARARASGEPRLLTSIAFFRGKVKTYETPLVEVTSSTRPIARPRSSSTRAGCRAQAGLLHLPDHRRRRCRGDVRVSAVAAAGSAISAIPEGIGEDGSAVPDAPSRIERQFAAFSGAPSSDSGLRPAISGHNALTARCLRRTLAARSRCSGRRRCGLIAASELDQRHRQVVERVELRWVEATARFHISIASTRPVCDSTTPSVVYAPGKRVVDRQRAAQRRFSAVRSPSRSCTVPMFCQARPLVGSISERRG